MSDKEKENLIGAKFMGLLKKGKTALVDEVENVVANDSQNSPSNTSKEKRKLIKRKASMKK